MLKAAEFLTDRMRGRLGTDCCLDSEFPLAQIPRDLGPPSREALPFRTRSGGGAKSIQGGRTPISDTITDFLALDIKFS
jgi:hypothetical protein